jgi:hypothetical protein
VGDARRADGRLGCALHCFGACSGLRAVGLVLDVVWIVGGHLDPWVVGDPERTYKKRAGRSRLVIRIAQSVVRAI